MKKINRFIAISLISLGTHFNTASATGMPVIDITAFTQMLLSYSEQLKEMLLFEKQIKQLGLDDILDIFQELQSTWDKLSNTSLELQSLYSETVNAFRENSLNKCTNYSKTSSNFKKVLENNKEKLKELFKNLSDDSDELSQKACLETLMDKQAISDINNADFIEAQNYLQEGDTQSYQKKMDEIKDRQAQYNYDSLEKQREVILKMNAQYQNYEKTKDSEKTAFNQLIESVKDAESKTDKDKSTTSLELQKEMLRLLEKQYTLQQETSNMLTTLLGQTIELSENIKTQEQIKQEDEELTELKNDWIRDNQGDFKKDAFGFPEFTQTTSSN